MVACDWKAFVVCLHFACHRDTELSGGPHGDCAGVLWPCLAGAYCWTRSKDPVCGIPLFDVGRDTRGHVDAILWRFRCVTKPLRLGFGDLLFFFFLFARKLRCSGNDGS